ncbi:MAG: 7-cyano-7-deazaguanine synthase QueC [Candidatus Cloacimonetes bacterium]|nr:7-cyano-7-deazaguanine synthase QueC [Candidatus Cloacimonadota bacterium]
MKNKGIVLVSGGMDSLVTAAVAVKECSETYFLHVSYGQRTEKRELESFHKIRDHYNPVDYMICNIEYLKQIGNSSLIDRTMILDNQIRSGQIPNTYVPFRNAHLLAIAVSWADSIEADRVYIGAVEEDSSGYPDCREVFLTAFNEAVHLGTKKKTPIIIEAPLLHLTKKEIVLKGCKLNVPFQYSWSCYQDNELSCGICASCQLRLKAFHEANVKDPLPYR